MKDVLTNPNIRKNRLRLTRCVILLCVFANIVQAASGPEKQDGPCISPVCIRTASSILEDIDLTVDPCDDFYQFSCGNFIETHIIPGDKAKVDAFSLIEDTLQDQLKSLIEEPPADNVPKSLRLPNKLYLACMNTTLIEELGSSPINEIAETLGGWPVIKGESWNSDNSWTWQNTIKQFRKLGFRTDYIFQFGVIADLEDSTKRILDLDQTSLGLNREYLVKGFNNTLVTAYYKYITDAAVQFGAKKEDALKELKESIQFEMDLADISLPKEELRNFSTLYNLRTVAKMQAGYPYINWKEYINWLLPETVQIDDDQIINLTVPDFFEKLGPLLAKTPNRTIANYLMRRIYSSSVPYLSEDLRKISLQYFTAVLGKKENQARWKECIDISISSLGIAVGSLYVRKYFNEDSKRIALDMVNDMKGTFGSIIRQVDWMDEKTRKSALEKLGTVASHIGYPDELIDDNEVEKYYKNLDINPSKYYQSYLRISEFGKNKSLSKLRMPVNKTDWTDHAQPARAGAYYSLQENSIQFPAGILQGKFFDANRPKYMNYGAIGSVIAHEMTHGFDDQGSQFDLNGNLIDWWQADTKQAYLTKARCIIEQYGNYTEKLTGLNLNGINTQGENVADNGGIKESYIAYKIWSAKYGPEPKLPGLDFSPEQMFWISAAQNWCSKTTTELQEVTITINEHSPSEFRVLGPMRNMKDFAKDFQCPEGTPMNPVHKCEVW